MIVGVSELIQDTEGMHIVQIGEIETQGRECRLVNLKGYSRRHLLQYRWFEEYSSLQ